ncbi:helix-turn-helix domain-containing protein [Pseudoruegeria sp. SK021]|uniref:helix-turn-helix domain-containing protein n=1 Tax=Pseudoruegeria sp. SK021 TaxID=1933035 RepID=UPI000A328653|nr:helix-turn-helix domain-containing protein [Pseudoruegeria sp. SK021]
MISTPHRQSAIALIDEAVCAGARRPKACAELEISDRTLRRWRKDGQAQPDQRPIVLRPEPANKLSLVERMAVLDVCNSTEFASLPPSQIVPKLADQGRYLASEIRHLLARLLLRSILAANVIWDWSRWRRAHQLDAARAHRKTRLKIQL